MAISLEPGYAVSYDNLGDVYMALGCFEDACDAYQTSVVSYESAPRPLIGQGEALYAMGRYEEARHAYEQAAEMECAVGGGF